jgi:RNA polymerase sigma-70 factor (ECF subfamily)
MVIFKDIKKFKHKGSFEGWAKRITVNVALQKFRKKSIIKFDDIEESKIPDEKVYVDVEEKEISLNFLLSLINKLPPQYQLIFNLYVLDEYTHKEISEILDISVGTSKSNLSRARKLLKKEIDAIKKLQL